MAFDVPRNPGGVPSNPAQGPDEALQLVAALQVKIDILRRAQELAPELAQELQETIDIIQRELRALD